MAVYYKLTTAKAPVNIAVIKYWGKSDESLKIPINDSLSGTLNIDEMCATTSVAISNTYDRDILWLNGKEQSLGPNSPAWKLIAEVRRLSSLESQVLSHKAHIVSYNNFPTAAGLASSAAGYACLAFVLGHAYGITDPIELSKLARQGSGSACRSLFGGFVQWDRGNDHDSSKASQVADHEHWSEMRVIICVISDSQKDVSSSDGMSRSVKTSGLIGHRAKVVVPERMLAIKSAIIEKDFETFASITMQDSNQFHAICLDSFPPIFYLNETSRRVIKICTIINAHYGCNKVAYTFDAGPNACIYLLDDFVPTFVNIMRHFFPPTMSSNEDSGQGLEIKGRSFGAPDQAELTTICDRLRSEGVESMPDSLSYLISTSIGGGPTLIEKHISDVNLKP